MSNFLLLLKCDLKKLISPKKNGKVGMLIAYVILAVCILIISISYTAIFSLILPEESKHISLALIMGIYTIFVLFTTVGNAKILFGAKDYDMLMALPIKPISIILSKLFYVYLINLAGAFFCLVPSAVTYMIVTKSGAITLLNTLLALPFAPLFPLVLGFIIGTLISIIGSKIKNKTLVGTIIAILFLVVYFYFVFTSGSDEVSDEEMANSLIKIQGVFAIFFAYSKGITGNYLLLGCYALFAVAISALYFAVLSKYYKQINTLIFTKRASANFKLQDEKVQSSTLLGSLLKREFKLFFSDSTIIINNLIGPVFSLLLGFAMLFNGGLNGMVANMQLEVSEAEVVELKQLFSIIIKNGLPYIPIFFMGTCFYSAFCISIEGKNMWMIKSMPISAKSYFSAKALVHIILNLPASLICIILLGISLEVIWYDVIIAVLITVAYSLFDSLLGLSINIKYHNFDWETTAEVVKRGTSVNIVAIVGMLAIVPFLIIQVLSSFINPYLGFAISFLIICGLVLLFYNLIFKNADEKLLKM